MFNKNAASGIESEKQQQQQQLLSDAAELLPTTAADM